MKDYKRFKENLDILEKHNEIHTPIFHLTDGKIHEQDLIRELISDCRELLNKIENGTLIELPCKVGDRIWAILGHNIFGRKVKEIKIHQNYSIVTSDTTGWKELEIYHEQEFGVIWFTDKAEAEEKLRELKENV